MTFNVETSCAGLIIGEVRWYSIWNRYCFFPIQNAVLEPDSLAEIVDFINELTEKRRGALDWIAMFTENTP